MSMNTFEGCKQKAMKTNLFVDINIGHENNLLSINLFAGINRRI